MWHVVSRKIPHTILKATWWCGWVPSETINVILDFLDGLCELIRCETKFRIQKIWFHLRIHNYGASMVFENLSSNWVLFEVQLRLNWGVFENLGLNLSWVPPLNTKTWINTTFKQIAPRWSGVSFGDRTFFVFCLYRCVHCGGRGSDLAEDNQPIWAGWWLGCISTESPMLGCLIRLNHHHLFFHSLGMVWTLHFTPIQLADPMNAE